MKIFPELNELNMIVFDVHNSCNFFENQYFKHRNIDRRAVELNVFRVDLAFDDLHWTLVNGKLAASRSRHFNVNNYLKGK